MVIIVCGWEPDNGSYQVIARDHLGRIDAWHTGSLDERWERLPDPVPCPITEPVTLLGYRSPRLTYANRGSVADTARVCADTPQGLPSVTLHPPRDAEPYGRWTWEGGPE